MNTIKERLKIVRNKLGFTQSKMAEALKIAKTTVQNYEYGTTNPSNAVLEKLKDLGFNSNWILYGKESMYISGFEISESSNFTPEFSRKFLHSAFDKIINLYTKSGKILKDGFSSSILDEINQILTTAQTEREADIILNHFIERISNRIKEDNS